MDLDWILLWLVVVSSTLGLVRLARVRPRPTGWVGIHGAILAITLLAALVLPAGAGILGGTLWLLLFVVPLRLIAAMNRATLRRDFNRAGRLARVLSWLHPFDGYREGPSVIAALGLIDQGRFEEAQERLRGSPAAARAIARTAFVQSFRQRADWEGALRWFPLPPDPRALRVGADEALLHLRALGERGEGDALARAFALVDAALDDGRHELERNGARAVLLAFAGRGEALERLWAGPLQGYPEEIRGYWRAVARDAVRDRAGAEALLAPLASSGSLLTRAASGRRLMVPVPDPAPPALVELALKVERELDQERRFGLKLGPSGGPPTATLSLIAATSFVFALELAAGGAENPVTLYRLGALVPGRVLAGEWWRLLTAAFLHYGWLHFLMNMYGLWLLGPSVERALGPGRFVTLYLVTGAGSMAGVFALWSLGVLPGGILLGASGAVLGVVGATAAILLRGWLVERAPIARRRLGNVVLIVLLQVSFDLATPEVSGAAHLSGLTLGFVWTLVTERLRARVAMT